MPAIPLSAIAGTSAGMYALLRYLRKGPGTTAKRHFMDDAISIPVIKGVQGEKPSSFVRLVLGAPTSPFATNTIEVSNDIGLQLRSMGIDTPGKLLDLLKGARTFNSEVSKAGLKAEGTVRRTADLSKATATAIGSAVGAVAGSKATDKKEQGAAAGAVAGGALGLLGGRGLSRVIKTKSKPMVDSLKEVAKNKRAIESNIDNMIGSVERYIEREPAANAKALSEAIDLVRKPSKSIAQNALRAYQNPYIWSKATG
jgi:hypothetical protein